MNKKGFTLAEIIIVITILSVITGLTSLILGTVLKAQTFFMANKALVDEARLAVERIIIDIRKIRSPTDIITFNVDELEFVNSEGENIHFVVSGDKLMRNGKVLTGQLKTAGAFQLTYKDSLGNQIVPPGAPDDIWFITMKLQLRNGEEEASMYTDIFPRNFSGDYVSWTYK